jgi:hypothetical protein
MRSMVCIKVCIICMFATIIASINKGRDKRTPPQINVHPPLDICTPPAHIKASATPLGGRQAYVRVHVSVSRSSIRPIRLSASKLFTFLLYETTKHASVNVIYERSKARP